LGSEREDIKEMINCFFLLPTKRENGWAYEPPFSKFIPGKNAFMRDQPKEVADFWPMF
jgi:hypothetical protein